MITNLLTRDSLYLGPIQPIPYFTDLYVRLVGTMNSDYHTSKGYQEGGIRLYFFPQELLATCGKNWEKVR